MNMTFFSKMIQRIIMFTVSFLVAGQAAISQYYSDNRPRATFRMDARDAGIVLRYGDGPDSCDILGEVHRSAISGYFRKPAGIVL
jgi:hypothetical protein